MAILGLANTPFTQWPIYMQTEIKICGLSTREAVSASVEAGANLLGFIFFEKSPRHVHPTQAAALSKHAGGTIKTVAVTVNADNAYLDSIVEALKPDYLQLHGAESPERVAEIKQRYALPAIKAFSIRTVSDFENIASYEGIADRFLLDAKAPKGSDLPGGNGVSFDWTLLSNLQTPTPVMLSGGLNLSNIISALEISKAIMVDVSSGVESSPGVKDIAKIKSFIKTVREYDALKPAAVFASS